MTPPTIDAGGLWLATETGQDGPRLATNDPQTAPLAAVLNAAASGALAGLGEALERGEGAETPVERVARPYPGDDFPAERERWRQLTGRDPGDDVYVVWAAYTPGVMIVPRTALRQGLQGLLALRAGDSDGERAWLDELEREATAVDRLEASPEVEDQARAAVKRRRLVADLHALSADVDEQAHPRLAAYRRAQAALRTAKLPADRAEGEMFVRDSAGWIHIIWRREDGVTPVVVRATPS